MAIADSPRSVSRIPILKLPPEWFEPALLAVLEAKGSRAGATRNVLERFQDKPGLTEKLAMRAFVIPTLTRLHFLRSTSDALFAAPNGLIWSELRSRQRAPYTGLCLRDFLCLSLGVPAELTKWTALRELSNRLGPPYPDRLGGMIRMLRKFPAPPAAALGGQGALSESEGDTFSLGVAELEQQMIVALQSGLRGKKIVGLDSLRIAALREIWSTSNAIASSFRLDRVLLRAMSEGRLCSPFASGTNALGELVLGRRPFGSVLSLEN